MSPRAKAIIMAVAERRGIPFEAIVGRCRIREISDARFEAMWELRAVKRDNGAYVFSLTQIGRIFDGRDHTTALSGIRAWDALRESPRAKRPYSKLTDAKFGLLRRMEGDGTEGQRLGLAVITSLMLEAA